MVDFAALPSIFPVSVSINSTKPCCEHFDVWPTYISVGWNLDGLREVWKQPFRCKPCSYSITFITLSSALVLLTDQTDQGKNLPKTILRNTPESNKYFCFRVHHFVQTTIFSKNVKTTVLTTLHSISFASYNITDITYTTTHYSKNSIFIVLTFLALKYKFNYRRKIKKMVQIKSQHSKPDQSSFR